MVVRLHLHQDVHRLAGLAVHLAARVGTEASGHGALDHRCVVLVRREHPTGACFGGPADHAEQGFRLFFAVDHELGVEDLVPAVLAIRLGEHHELHVVRVTAELRIGFDEVVDFVFGQCEAEARVFAHERVAAFAAQGHAVESLGRMLLKQARALGLAREHRLRHAVVKRTAQGLLVVDFTRDFKADAALDTPHLLEATELRDVGGLGRPGGDGAKARRDDVAHPIELSLLAPRSVA